MIDLDDAATGKRLLADTQRALLNILDDSISGKEASDEAFRASVNILADLAAEKAFASDLQGAMLNILEDFEGEKAWLEAAQRGILNILDDFDVERIRSERAYRDLAREAAERKQAEDALQVARDAAIEASRELARSNAELESFSYSVAHDLRAPLRAIGGFGTLLLEGQAGRLDDEGRRMLDVVIRNVGRMGELIDALLAFSRLGRSALTMRRTEMTPLVRSVADELLALEPGRDVGLSIVSLGVARCHPATMRQVWGNLLSNALKFTRERPSARIEVEREDAPGEIVFRVRDNGVGFDMRYADKLFGVFQRLHTQSEFEGTGVGLATVGRIVQMHGGRAWAEGTVDDGATFSFSVPAGEEQA